MALSNPRAIFGVHQTTFYNRTTGLPYGTIKAQKSSSLSLSGELVKLTGGSNKYPWAVEDGLITAELSLKVSEYPAFMFELMLGKAPTETSSDTAGSVANFVDKNGASIKDASNGISAISVIPTTGAANLKFGHYVIKAVSSTTVDIYMSTDIQHARGTDVSYQNDLLKVTASPITIAAGTNDAADLGLRLTGVGTPAFTTGDTAEFQVIPPHSGAMEVSLGGASDISPEFGAIVYAQKRSDGSMTCVDLYRCRGIGLPLGFEQGAFSESEIKAEALYDSEKDAICKFWNVKAS
jgi:hypothetical protein